eukprot:scaffold26288_cov111-Isochrysis_galbana.AAC.6
MAVRARRRTPVPMRTAALAAPRAAAELLFVRGGRRLRMHHERETRSSQLQGLCVWLPGESRICSRLPLACQKRPPCRDARGAQRSAQPAPRAARRGGASPPRRP